MLYKTINISPGLHKALRMRAAETGITISQLIEDACDVYLDPLGGLKPTTTSSKGTSLSETNLATPLKKYGFDKLPKPTIKLCPHGFQQTYCTHSKCEYYASWR